MDREVKDTFRIWYDEKKEDIRAEGKYTYMQDGSTYSGSIKSEGLDNVNLALQNFLSHQTESLQSLTNGNKPAIYFSPAKKGEVVKAAILYEFDYVLNMIKKRRLSRSDMRIIDGREYDNGPIIDTITESVDKEEILREVIKLNPTVKFEIVRDSAGLVSHLLSSVSGEDLILPGMFYYNEKNGITNKHKTKSGAFTSIDVRPLVKEEKPVSVEPPKPVTPTEVKPVVSEPSKPVVSTEPPKVTTTPETKPSEEKKPNIFGRIKNFTICNWKRLAAIVGILGTGYMLYSATRGNTTNVNYNYVDETHRDYNPEQLQ